MMKIFYTFSLIFAGFLGSAQNYQMEESDFGLMIKDKIGTVMFNEYFMQVFECMNAPDLLVATNEYDLIFLLDTKTRKKIQLYEYEHYLKIDDVCRLAPGDYVRYYENKKVGLLKFPDSVVLKAEYSMIYPFDQYNNACILQKGKKYAHYHYLTGKLSNWFDIYMKDDFMGFDDNRSYLEDFAYFFALEPEAVKIMRIDGSSYTLLNEKSKRFEYHDDCMLPVTEGNLCGYVNDRGELEIPFIYEDAGPFKEDCMIAYVKIGGKYGYINSSGEVVIPFMYDHAESFIDGYAKVKSGQEVFYIDQQGNKK